MSRTFDNGTVMSTLKVDLVKYNLTVYRRDGTFKANLHLEIYGLNSTGYVDVMLDHFKLDIESLKLEDLEEPTSAIDPFTYSLIKEMASYCLP